MKRTLFLIDSLNSGGAQRQLVGLAALLRKKGYQVRVLTYYDFDFYGEELRLNDVEHVCVNTGTNFVARVWKLNREIRKYHPDVLISFLDTPNKISCSLKALTFASWRLLVSERNTTQQLSRGEKQKFSLYRLADLIVSNSKSQARFIAKHYPRYLDKSVAITNFVDTEYFSPNLEKKISSTKRIICVGRIAPQKNIPNLIRAVHKVRLEGMKNFVVDWYGESSVPTYHDECNALISELGVEDVFRFHKPESNIRDRYREADIFCLPSIYEGFPNVLCEAMSCGLPVICSRVCDNPDIAIEGKSGYLFDPNDIDNMSQSINRIVSLSDSQIFTMSKYNRERSISLFSPKEFLRKYEVLINS